ncbi:MAG: FixH family protein [Ignavibacteriales bacterium]|nr:FixH family protein [Ignavibacteriales bacterium]
MKKMNWGSWIVVSFILFALGTFTMIYISMNSRVDLVTDDYYEKELKYQDHIDVVKSTNELEGKVSFVFASSTITISYPNIEAPSKYSGAIMFFRPSDKALDFSQPVAVDSTYSQTIATDKLIKGMWRVKISWSVGQQNYYTEQPVIIQ